MTAAFQNNLQRLFKYDCICTRIYLLQVQEGTNIATTKGSSSQTFFRRGALFSIISFHIVSLISVSSLLDDETQFIFEEIFALYSFLITVIVENESFKNLDDKFFPLFTKFIRNRRGLL